MASARDGREDLLDHADLRGQGRRRLLAAVRPGSVHLVQQHVEPPPERGRQSASMQAIKAAGERPRTSRAIMSSSPRTALTGDPSGAVSVSGTP